MTSVEITGEITHIGAVETFGTFQKRVFILMVKGKNDWKDYLSISTTKDRMDLLDKFRVGDLVDVNVNIQGRLAKNDDTKAYNELQAWKIYAAPPSNAGERPARAQREYKLDDRSPNRDRLRRPTTGRYDEGEDEINF